MKAVVLLLALCLVAAAVSGRRNYNAKINQKMGERLSKVKGEAGFPGFPGISNDAASLRRVSCGGVCKASGGEKGVCRQKCRLGELSELSKSCGYVQGQFCFCCIVAEVMTPN